MNRASVKGESSLRMAPSVTALLWIRPTIPADYPMPDTLKFPHELECALSPNHYV